MSDYWKPPHYVYEDAPHYVYEMYAADGTCLYVGCSSDIGKRIDTHRLLRDWWPEVARMTVIAYPDYEAGSDAERQRITALSPRHNTIFTNHDDRGGGWATRRAIAQARHEQGEICQSSYGCIECNDTVGTSVRSQRRARARTKRSREGAA